MSLDFLPGVDRWQVLATARRALRHHRAHRLPEPRPHRGAPRPGARAPASRCVNIDHHPGQPPLRARELDRPGRRRHRRDGVRPPQRARRAAHAGHRARTSSPRSTPTPARSATRTRRRATFRIAAALVAAGAEPALVSDRLYQRRAPDALALARRGCCARVEVSEDGRVAWLALPAGAVSEAFIAAEDLVTYPRSIGGVEVAVPPPRARRRRGEGEPAGQGRRRRATGSPHRFGGGGHENAAGCTVRRAARRGDAPRCSPRCGAPSTAPALVSEAPIAPASCRSTRAPGVTSFQVVAHRAPRAPRAAHRPRRHARSRRDRGAARSCRRGDEAHAVPRRPRQGVRGHRAPRRDHRHAGPERRVLSDAPGARARRAPRSRPRSRRSSARIQQVPPMYSARPPRAASASTSWPAQGIEVEREPREVTVHAIALEDVDAARRRRSASCCGKGTYVRTLAADLGAALGCGAAVERSCARGSAPTRSTTRCRWRELREARTPSSGRACARVDSALAGLARRSAWTVAARRVRHGQAADVVPAAAATGPRARLRRRRSRCSASVSDGGREHGRGPTASCMRILRGLQSFPPERGRASSRSAPSTASISAIAPSSARR